MYALELGKTRFLRWLDMSCRLQIYRFYVGESTISRIISDLNFPPLYQNLSRKCKQTLKNLGIILENTGGLIYQHLCPLTISYIIYNNAI